MYRRSNECETGYMTGMNIKLNHKLIFHKQLKFRSRSKINDGLKKEIAKYKKIYKLVR